MGPVLETRDLTIRFGGHVAVDAVSCRFQPGTLTAIVGPNGAGKTTYFNLVSGQLPATSGQVLLFGEDVTRTGAPLRVSACPTLDRALLATGFPYDLSGHNNFAEWAHFHRRAAACRRLGAAALDLCLVAKGQFDGYWESHLAAWDIAAGALIVVEAGGIVTNPHGGAFDAHSGEAVASNGAIHGRLIQELAGVRP